MASRYFKSKDVVMGIRYFKFKGSTGLSNNVNGSPLEAYAYDFDRDQEHLLYEDGTSTVRDVSLNNQETLDSLNSLLSSGWWIELFDYKHPRMPTPFAPPAPPAPPGSDIPETPVVAW